MRSAALIIANLSPVYVPSLISRVLLPEEDVPTRCVGRYNLYYYWIPHLHLVLHSRHNERKWGATGSAELAVSISGVDCAIPKPRGNRIAVNSKRLNDVVMLTPPVLHCNPHCPETVFCQLKYPKLFSALNVVLAWNGGLLANVHVPGQPAVWS